MMSYDKASPNAKIGCSNSNDPEFLEQLVREGKTNREIALILDLDYGVDYYEARGIWHRGWIGQGYAALVTVDGHRLETLPQIKTFFGFRRDSL